MTKKVYIKTYGCQMNEYDSARMADVLAPHGFVATASPDEADLIILNTCHIREKAADKVFSELGRLRRIKLDRGAVLAVAGCVAQAEGAEIRRRAPFVDLVVGPQTYHRLPDLLTRAAQAGERGVVDTDFPVESKFDLLPEQTAPQGVSAFLAVQEGCDKFCSFCVVPYTRGAEFSRPVADVVAEARRLAAAGVRELTLVGQNVNAYHGEDETGRSRTLAELIRRLAEIDGLRRLRYTTSHPLEMGADLVAAHGDEPKLMPFLHLPVQSGSDAILAAMNRRHNIDDYRRIVDRLRAARPDLALSTDVIVGFPGETDADFRATLDLVHTVGFAQAFSFKYSPRPGTPAANLPAQVPEAVKNQRLAELQAVLRTQQIAFNRACVGRTLDILFERAGRHPGQLVGRSPYLQSVHADAAGDCLGIVHPVAITEASQNSLSGRLADNRRAA